MRACWDSYVKCLKTLEIKDFLFDVAQATGASLEIVEHKKGIIRERIDFVVKGTKEEVTKFRDICLKKVKEYHNL
jgi:hypothetical protein